ncbi:MAG: hypothetical protein HWE30_12720 [Methylocystaceae bacterium]|nr:hypothetical protein [Methylocystaceae bacterium]
MKPVTSHTLSTAAAVLFALWVVGLWLVPEKVDHQAKSVVMEKPKEMAEPVVQLQETPPQTLILPAPPQVAPKPALVVEKVAEVKEEIKPTAEPVVVNKPEAKLAPKPAPKPVVQANPQPKPQPKPAPKPVEKIHQVSATQATGGRALLRVLEHGKGPLIEIAWPQQARARDSLHGAFQSCFGMENALMDTSGNLFRMDEPRGVRWEINLDRFSGFLRQASGQLPATEERIARSVKRHHRNLSGPIMVRIFPRRVDASLLAGLKAVVGEGYMQAKSIQARYVQEGSRILVRDIRLDGRTIQGAVELSKVKRCSGRA